MKNIAQTVLSIVSGLLILAISGFYVSNERQSEKIIRLEMAMQFITEKLAESNVTLNAIADEIATQDDLDDLREQIEREIERLRAEFKERSSYNPK